MTGLRRLSSRTNIPNLSTQTNLRPGVIRMIIKMTADCGAPVSKRLWGGYLKDDAAPSRHIAPAANQS